MFDRNDRLQDRWVRRAVRKQVPLSAHRLPPPPRPLWTPASAALAGHGRVPGGDVVQAVGHAVVAGVVEHFLGAADGQGDLAAMVAAICCTPAYSARGCGTRG